MASDETYGYTPGTPHIIRYPDVDAIARAAADLFVRLARQADARGAFHVALSGGSTPRRFHALLAAPPYRDQVAWEQVQVYWGDERCVGPDDPESNYRMARETLLERVPIAHEHIHRIHAELADPEAAAEDYAATLRTTFALAPGALPRFDLILLGMGPDGHTASLFPHTAALHVRDRLVAANAVPQLHTSRITLTEPVINNAREVAFLVAGADKATALAAVLEGPRDPKTYPSQLIAPSAGTLHWYVDTAAAEQLRAH